MPCARSSVQGLLAILLAIPIYPLLRRILAPALIDYAPARRLLIPGRRRRRARAGSSKRPPTTVGSPRHEVRRRRGPRSRGPIGGRA